MDGLDSLKELLEDGRTVRPVEEGIYSVLRTGEDKHHYDRMAALYDLVVGMKVYNRIMWGGSPHDYTAFARQAVGANPNGPLLDAACGSLLFTVKAYLECDRRVIAFDQSLGMLKRARTRLIELAGGVPKNILLLQADLNDPPFRPSSLQTILCMNVLHLLEDGAALVSNLGRLLTSEGRLYLTSLILNGRSIGDWYLGLLHQSGEMARPRTRPELSHLLESSVGRKVSCRVMGNMAYTVTSNAS
jgi:ubiquinone/menaquinone biosynthesis C-methylase UbiE